MCVKNQKQGVMDENWKTEGYIRKNSKSYMEQLINELGDGAVILSLCLSI